MSDFVGILGSEFFAGVYDPQLKALCDFLTDTYGTDPEHHVTAPGAGACIGLAAGYHLATGKVPVVYLPSSCEGDIVDPAASLMNDSVCGIPCIFVIGWKGEPGTHDGPQDVYQGKIALPLLETLDIDSMVIDTDTEEEDVEAAAEAWKPLLDKGKQVAFVVRKGALECGFETESSEGFPLDREEVIRHILQAAGEDPIVAASGTVSRGLYGVRDSDGQPHDRDFLTVGAAGECASVAMGVAAQKPDTTVWCIDGDVQLIAGMGSMALIGPSGPRNLIHIVLSGSSEDTDLVGVAMACGYKAAARAENTEQLDFLIKEHRPEEGPMFLEVKCSPGPTAFTGVPETTPKENKESFMTYLGGK